MKVSAQYAEEHFADILRAADSGEEVEIARNDLPTYRLTLVKPAPKPTPRRPRRELLGSLEGKVKTLTDAEWEAVDKEFEELVLNSLGIPAVAK
jgi:antitoxin (DNA-binding transcriptional repressor) of toxin-antitoxin stability system